MSIVMFKKFKKSYLVLVLFQLTILLSLILLYYRDTYIIRIVDFENNLECHDVIVKHDFPEIASDKIRGWQTLFFLETSCRGTVNSRQACAIESAAKMNPKWQVNIFFAGPVTEVSRRQLPLKNLLLITNVNFYRIHKVTFTENTPVHKLFVKNVIAQSKYGVHHMSDLLRFVTLHKYGGMYLDLDVVVTRSFDTLSKNFVAKENNLLVSAGAIALTKDGIGKKISNLTLNILKSRYDPRKWCDSSVGVLGGAMKNICSVEKIWRYSANTCQGVDVYPTSYFYPYHYKVANVYFESNSTEIKHENEYAHQMWNKITQHFTIKNGSWYAQLAQKYCPITYQSMIGEFGGK